MATFGFDALGQAPGRLFSRLADKSRAALAGRSATTRWGLVALVVGGLSLAGYLVSSAVLPAERVYLAAGRRFQDDDLVKITRALDAQRVDYLIDDRRLTVPARSADAAAAALAKLEIGPRSLDEIRGDASKGSLWESPRDRDEREQRERARVSEALINQLPGVVGSFVTVNRVKQRGVLRPTTKPTAFVSLQTEGGRELPFGVIDSITAILTGNETGLTPEAITILDRGGHKYLDAGNPALSALSTNRAREEELSRRILERLDGIAGVRVSVQLATPAPPVELRPAPRAEDTAPPTPSGLIVGVNRAMSLEPDPADELPEPAPETADNHAAAPEAVAPPPPRTSGRVWVSIPRSYYYKVGFLPGRDEPSQDDLRSLVERVETRVRNVVRLVCSEEESTDWESPIVDRIDDELPLPPQSAVAEAARSRRLVKDWATAGAAGALAAALVALGTWIFGGRRSTRRSEPNLGRIRRHKGQPGAPPPTERVLEFVRRNPESAFGVLNRWTNPGGGKP